MISVSQVSLRLGNRFLLQHVSFEIPQGGYTAVIGPNGAGKSTLLRVLAGILSGWSGEIRIFGEPLQNLKRKQIARKTALVQQSAAIPFSFTVRQIVEMGRYPHLKPLAPPGESDEAVIREAMRDMELESFASRKIETLSGGERQRVFLAAALAQEPKILLLDEPATWLDYQHQCELYRFLQKINRERGVTVMEVTHDVNRAVMNASHLVALCGGCAVYEGPPSQMMNPERLEKVFGPHFCLVNHPQRHHLMVLPK
jgi:iron complex transport system ATP-binding protein